MSVLGSPYILGGAVAFAFSAGWSVNGWRHDAALQSLSEEIRAEEQLKLDALRTSLDAANSERLLLAADLASEKADIKIKYRTITQELPVYVPKNTDACNYDLSSGLIGLLNNAARGEVGYSQDSGQSAGQRFGIVPRTSANSTD